MATIGAEELRSVLISALTEQGFSIEAAAALARQTVLAEELGQKAVGLAHLFDYTDGVAAGRIDPGAVPVIDRPAPTMIQADGRGGLPQTGFDSAYGDLVGIARELGMSLFLSRNAMLCGSLGTYVLRLAEDGLIGFAVTNGSPLLAGSGSKGPVFCTNPMAFAAPRADGCALLVDQSCSATAYVNVRAAAEAGETIPPGWAIDRDGQPTTDPKAALEGSLLPFGGARGSNLALMVEVLAGGLANARFSIDAAPFDRGDACPATGLVVLAIDPAPAGRDFRTRLAAYLRRLGNDFGVYIPGLSKARHRQKASDTGLEIDDALLARLRAMVPAG